MVWMNRLNIIVGVTVQGFSPSFGFSFQYLGGAHTEGDGITSVASELWSYTVRCIHYCGTCEKYHAD